MNQLELFLTEGKSQNFVLFPFFFFCVNFDSVPNVLK